MKRFKLLLKRAGYLAGPLALAAGWAAHMPPETFRW